MIAPSTSLPSPTVALGLKWCWLDARHCRLTMFHCTSGSEAVALSAERSYQLHSLRCPHGTAATRKCCFVGFVWLLMSRYVEIGTGISRQPGECLVICSGASRGVSCMSLTMKAILCATRLRITSTPCGTFRVLMCTWATPMSWPPMRSLCCHCASLGSVYESKWYVGHPWSCAVDCDAL